MLADAEVGDYKILHRIASGWGGTVYLASPCLGSKPRTVALKYPTNNREVRTLEALSRGTCRCLGVPTVYGSGLREGKPFIAMDLLKAPLLALLSGLSPGAREWREAAAGRWARLRPLGRLLLRRLEAIHHRGIVHCDIKPSNIAIGLVHGRGVDEDLPFFIDYGLAHPYPGGGPIKGHAGTLEYSSVRSADGGPRLPLDDVEALGWVLIYGVVGDLPWFKLTRKLRELGKCDRGLRDEHCRKVQRMKIELLESSMGKVEGVAPPTELLDCLRLCRRMAADAAPPDYAAFARLMGGSSWDGPEAEQEDLAAFHAQCVAGVPVDLPEAPAGGRPQALLPRYFLVGTWNSWTAEEMTQDSTVAGLYRTEVQLPRDGGEFQILQGGDWQRALHPAKRRAGLEAANPVLGPDAEGHGINWAVDGQAGDVLVIQLKSPLREGEPAHLSWQRVRRAPLEKRRLAASPRAKYFAVGSWDSWSSTHEMTWSGTFCRLLVQLGDMGRESFQILENGDWDRKLHPSTRDATPHESHTLLGPGKHGHGKNWMIGGHKRDRAVPSACFEVRLLLLDGSPCRVQWVRVQAKDDAAGAV